MPDYQGGGPFAPHTVVAACEVDGVAATFNRNFGAESVVRTGVGEYTLIFSFTVDGNMDFLVLTVNGPIAGARSGQVERTGGKTVLVKTRSEIGALADADWTCLVLRLGQGK